MLLYQNYGKSAVSLYLSYLKNACDLFDKDFYRRFYMSLEQYIKMPIDYFMIEIANCNMTVGYGNNLGEIKTYLMQQVLQNHNIQLYASSFYVVKEKLKMEQEEAGLYFDSWMQLHRACGQTSFNKINENSPSFYRWEMNRKNKLSGNGGQISPTDMRSKQSGQPDKMAA